MQVGSFISTLDYIDGSMDISSHGDGLLLHYYVNVNEQAEEEKQFVKVGSFNSNVSLLEQEIDNEQSIALHPVRLKIGPVESDGAPKVAIEPPETDTKYFISHDFSTKTSWWQNSVRVEKEVLSYVGSDIWASEHTDWINLRRIEDRADVADFSSTNFYNFDDKSTRSVRLYVGSELVHTYTGDVYDGDPEIDFDAGTVMLSEVGSDALVEATYSYATTSTYRFKPMMPDRRLRLYKVELQTQASALFPPNGFAFRQVLRNDLIDQYFPDGLVVDMPFRHPRVYYDINDFMSYGNGGQDMEACGRLSVDGGGNGSKMFVLPFDYQSLSCIQPTTVDLGFPFGEQEVDVWVELYTRDHKVVTNCDMATVTYYCFCELLPED